MNLLNFSGNKFQPPARRIISLVPSLTELLAQLELHDETVGITKFCVHPHAWFRSKSRMGGTKDVRLNRVMDEAPDLVIASKEENEQAQIEAIAAHFPVLLTDVCNLQDALQAIVDIGHCCHRQQQAEALVALIKERFQELAKMKTARKRAAYFIWRDPWMVAGGDTYINDMLWKAGYENVFSHKSRYPETSEAELQMLAPELLLFSSEPFPFRPHHAEEIKAFLPHSTAIMVDGEMFSWYGSRMLMAPAYFAQLRKPPPPTHTLVR